MSSGTRSSSSPRSRRTVGSQSCVPCHRNGMLTLSPLVGGLRRIRAHIRILENGAPITNSQRSRSVDHGRRRHSVGYPAPSPYVDYSRKHNLEYHPDQRSRVGAPPDQFIKLEKQSTYSRGSSSNASSRVGRSESVRHESRSRGRSSRRYDSYDSGDEDSDYYYEKRQYRGRSSQR